MANNNVGFATLIASPEQLPAVNLMIASLQRFGGVFINSPIWIVDGTQTLQSEQLDLAGVEIVPLALPPATRDYFFARKVAACAQLEAMTAGWVSSLVLIDPECLILRPPALFELEPKYEAALRPVHIKNVGLLQAEPLDSFWEGIYRLVGVHEPVMTVESFVDHQKIRAYFNSHMFAINPALGLMRRWADLFECLVTDELFQQSACQDRLHRIFLFQALLSALLVSSVGPERIRILPPTYNYPYNLHQQVPLEVRARSFNELTTLVWEGRSLAPDQVDDIAIEEPLKSWLASRHQGN